TTRAPVCRFAGHNSDVSAVAYSPGGDIVATGSSIDGSVCLWDPATGKERGRLPPLDQRLVALAFTPDGRAVASGHADGLIGARAVATGKRIRPSRHDVKTWVDTIAFSPDGKTLASACGIEVRLWDVASGMAIAKLKGNQDRHCLAFSPDGHTL